MAAHNAREHKVGLFQGQSVNSEGYLAANILGR
jgi:hypothetical protein